MTTEDRFAAIIHAHHFQHPDAETKEPAHEPGPWANKQALHHELTEEMAGRVAIR